MPGLGHHHRTKYVIMDDRIPLNLLGLSFSPVKDGAYFLILAQENGPYRIPIVIGASEAQSIAMALEGVTPSRPVTHDLFVTFADAVGVEVTEMCIYTYEEGIFYAELSFRKPDGTVGTLDARTSDAVAVAVRTRIPMFTTHAILRETGMIIEEDQENNSRTMRQPTEEESKVLEESISSEREESLESKSTDELEIMLEQFVAAEDYAEAERISAELERRAKNTDDNSNTF